MKNHFNIAFYCSSLSWGGLEMNTLRHACWMQERGHTTSLFCVKGSRLYDEGLASSVKVIAVDRNKKNFDFKSAFKLAQSLKELKVDFVWFRDKRDLSTIGLAKTFSRGKFKVLFQQAMQIGVPKTHLLHTIRFNKIDAWIAPLEYMAEQIKSRTKFNMSKVHVVPLAIDIEKFNKNGLERSQARLKFGFEPDDVVVGIIGRIDPHKAQQFVKDTIVALRAQYPRLKLLIVGNKTEGEWLDYYKTLRKDIDDKHSSRDVVMLPFMDDVTSFYNAIDVFVMASAKETFGMVTIEAMMAGKKIAGTNTFGTLELLQNEEFGYYFIPNDTNSLKEALSQILSKPVEASNKALKAKEFAVLTYSHKVECERIEQILYSIKD